MKKKVAALYDIHRNDGALQAVLGNIYVNPVFIRI
ncbi:hypothetical protein SAMN06264849_103293 [Melghirimyces algeriensis]|uniref:Uncharacterized protein n=1 Tax=Melghirimyces algeriensis TaxID=910412 RepID=A0A521CDQ9_9BACL|nr:hypothetical protein SAMN06264849_103293 [Melghirimyces algeriensis]